MHVQPLHPKANPREEVLGLELVPVALGGAGCQPPAVASHNLVDDEHAGVSAVLVHNIPEEGSALIGGGPSPEGELDRVHVVVDCLGQAYHSQVIVIASQELSEISSCGVGIISSYRMQDADSILDQLVCRYLLRVFSLLGQTPLYAILHICELDPAVSNRRTTTLGKDRSHLSLFLSHHKVVALQQSLVAINIADDLDTGVVEGVALDQVADGC
mmetsp:Transcript_3618/g.5733  ORF Transcript_3618/g.5733 Transcript_3618/m.5733 type:complete len:215 (-) Transcript_3618:289-933(-)